MLNVRGFSSSLLPFPPNELNQVHAQFMKKYRQFQHMLLVNKCGRGFLLADRSVITLTADHWNYFFLLFCFLYICIPPHFLMSCFRTLRSRGNNAESKATPYMRDGPVPGSGSAHVTSSPGSQPHYSPASPAQFLPWLSIGLNSLKLKKITPLLMFDDFFIHIFVMVSD